MPLLDSPRSCCTVGAGMETMVWSINVIATAKIIAVKTRLFDWPRAPAACVMPIPPYLTTVQFAGISIARVTPGARGAPHRDQAPRGTAASRCSRNVITKRDDTVMARDQGG